MHPRRRTLLRLALAVLDGCAAAFGALILTINQAGYHDDARPADAILVLGAGVLANGDPSPALRARVEHALTLYDQGYAPLIAFTGGEGQHPPAESAVAVRMALASGAPPDAILSEAESHTTAQNVANIAPLLRAHGVRRVLMVTSPFHSWRARHMLEDAGFEVYASPAMDDPAEYRPVARAYYVTREGVVSVLYFLFGI
jgi:uncharacterized SAM-binding protein YcdF (DUF218 family)